MRKEWNDVKEFHEKFGHPVATTPVAIDKKRALSRGKWMNEEVAEFLVADDIYEQADAMIDVMYFALGTMVEMGLEPDQLFAIVQEANMSKLWPDGKPHYNPKDGKIMKPEGWEDPKPKIKAYIDNVIGYQLAKASILEAIEDEAVVASSSDNTCPLSLTIDWKGAEVGVDITLLVEGVNEAKIQDLTLAVERVPNESSMVAFTDEELDSVELGLSSWLQANLVGCEVSVNLPD
ncbi:MAG: hypothetical protein R3Y37_09800 [Rikenellaceae bacterium]